MFDVVQHQVPGPDGPLLQRAKGRARIGVACRADGAVRLCDLHQSGSAKVMVPRVHGPVPEAVFLNTAGGVTGGDHFDYRASVGAGAALRLTTQTAERAYASTGQDGRIDVQVTVDAGAHLDWLPQETILFDQSRLHRRTTIDLRGDATALMLEIIVIGRAAMGEVPQDFQLFDQRDVRRDGQVIWIDPQTVSSETMMAKAGLNGARAMVTLAAFGPQAAQLPIPASADLHHSVWDDRLIVRGLFDDLWPLKQALIPYLSQLTKDRGGVPRVWQI